MLDSECQAQKTRRIQAPHYQIWAMSGLIGGLAAHAASSPSGLQDGPLPFQDVTGRQWVALNLANSKECYKNFLFDLLHSNCCIKH